MKLNTRGVRGFSLVEALVALVVMSIGMLGIAALYVESLRANRTALVRTQAINFANDMADRIRANRAGREWYNVNVSSEDTNDECEPGGDGCAPPQQAQHDKAAWLATIEQELPGGTGTVEWQPTVDPPEIYTVRVQWAETGQDEAQFVSMRVLL